MFLLSAVQNYYWVGVKPGLWHSLAHRDWKQTYKRKRMKGMKKIEYKAEERDGKEQKYAKI